VSGCTVTVMVPEAAAVVAIEAAVVVVGYVTQRVSCAAGSSGACPRASTGASNTSAAKRIVK